MRHSSPLTCKKGKSKEHLPRNTRKGGKEALGGKKKKKNPKRKPQERFGFKRVTKVIVEDQ